MARGRIERRGSKTRKMKPVILIVTEGADTERLYFEKFRSRQKNIEIRVLGNTRNGSKTDYINLIKKAIMIRDQDGLSAEQGDSVYVVADGDVKEQTASALETKNQLLAQARGRAEREKIILLISNPCFELWLLLHYVYTTRFFPNYEAVKTMLMQAGLPDYEKNKDVYAVLQEHTALAIKNAKRLDEYHSGQGSIPPFGLRENPYTEVYKLVEKIMPEN